MKEKRSFIGKQMVRFSRGRWYAGIIQFLMILVLTIRSFDTKAIIGISQFWSTILAIPLGIGFMWGIGYIDDRYGFFREQKKYGSQINPFLKKILNEVEEIKKRVSDEGEF